MITQYDDVLCIKSVKCNSLLPASILICHTNEPIRNKENIGMLVLSQKDC